MSAPFKTMLRALLAAFALGLAPAFPAAAEQSFEAWLSDFRQEAIADGVMAATVDKALKGVQPIPRVLELDRQQPEFTLSFPEYLAKVVNDGRVVQGQKMMRENQGLLGRVAERYKVQPRFIVALWGIESDYGRLAGTYQIIPSLVTLAYDGRRSSYFRSELIAALKIVDQDKIEPNMMLGSWAGAMGQSQFMPSSFLRYAVDFDGDGRRDIWHSRADVFASAANYLAQAGWRGDETWGRPVRVPASFKLSEADLKTAKSLSDWNAEGLRRVDGGELPAKSGLSGSVILPDGGPATAYLVYDNFRSILKWNRSYFFGIAVGTLADRIGD
jgi:membrane-bound lytic murein transglycosylase B